MGNLILTCSCKSRSPFSRVLIIFRLPFLTAIIRAVRPPYNEVGRMPYVVGYSIHHKINRLLYEHGLRAKNNEFRKSKLSLIMKNKPKYESFKLLWGQ